MLVLAIVFAVVAIAAGAWGVTQAKAAGDAKSRLGSLEQRLRALETEAATAAEKVAAAEQSAREADQRAAEQARRAEQAAKDGRRSDEMAEDAVKRAITAERDATEAAARAQRAEQARVEAERDRAATLAGAAPFKPEALWQLELQRIERLWRDRLALQPGEPSPLVTGKDVLGEAVRILADTSREESGVVVDLMWHVDFDCPADRCLQLVRLAEELVAAMRISEGGELEVIGEEDRTVFFLVRTLPPIELPDRLIAVLDDFGVMREVHDTTVVVRVPARDDAKLDELTAAGEEGDGGSSGEPGEGGVGDVVDLRDDAGAGEASAAADDAASTAG